MGNSELMPASIPAQQMTTTPADLLAIAVNQGADLDKLDKLMQLQERWEANEARKAFTVAMTGFRSEPVDIYKTKNVSFSGTSYNHAELSDVTQAINPALAKHNLSFRWDITQDGSTITVACSLTHIAGHSERVTMTAPPDDSGKKNRIQQIASTVTYLQRYTLLAITGMSTKGMDDDGRTAEEELPEEQLTPEQEAAAREERKRQYFIAAYEKNEDTVLQIKERLAYEDFEGAAAAWFDLSQQEQMALYIAPTKAGQYKEKCFTTAQRTAIKEMLPKYRKNNNNHGEEE